MNAKPATPRDRRGKGFRPAHALVSGSISRIGESRGFAVSRLLTRWDDIVGPEVAEMARPLKVSFAKGGLGATLTVLVPGAVAPLVQAQIPQIIERVNACYGYAAISRIRLTQTAPEGFAEAQTPFSPARREPAVPLPDPATERAAQRSAAGVADSDLRQALEDLAKNILSRTTKSAPKR